MRIAEVGNVVEWESKETGTTLKGVVITVMDSAVVVDQTINENWRTLKLEERTVVNHKRYTVSDEKVDAKTVEKHSGVTTLKVVPGSLENYTEFKKQGYSDNKIRMMWQDADKEVKWYANKFQAWKAEHDLVKSYKKEDELSTKKPELDVAKDEPVAASEAVKDLPDTSVEPAKTEAYDREEPLVFHEPVKVPVKLVPSQSETAIQSTLQAELDAVKAELDATKRELWSERTSRLFAMQAELDALICESNRLQISDYDNEHILATIVELAEVAQEEQSFKYWKKNKSVERAKLVEELADVLHFILSRGVQHGVRQVTLVDLEPRETVTDQMLLIIELLVEFRKELNKTNLVGALFQAFYGLTVLLQFDWSEIVSAYDVKNLENKARQNRNY